MFSIILPGRPCLTSLQPIPNSPNQFAFSFPSQPHFSHIIVFLLPGSTLPSNTGAGVYLQLPGEDFKFLGAIANDKQSAIFKVTLPPVSQQSPVMTAQPDINLGISVDSVDSLQQQLAQLQSQQEEKEMSGKVTTKVLAQRIIKNAFNFLAGFSGRVLGSRWFRSRVLRIGGASLRGGWKWILDFWRETIRGEGQLRKPHAGGNMHWFRHAGTRGVGFLFYRVETPQNDHQFIDIISSLDQNFLMFSAPSIFTSISKWSQRTLPNPSKISFNSSIRSSSSPY
jgi:hypothetical protein